MSLQVVGLYPNPDLNSFSLNRGAITGASRLFMRQNSDIEIQKLNFGTEDGEIWNKKTSLCLKI